MSESLEHADDAWVTAGPRGEHHGDAAQTWRELQSQVDDAPTPRDSRLDLSGRAGYHSIIRSCLSMMLYQIDVATARLIEQGHAHSGQRTIELAGITDIPEWMTELSGANVAGLFLRGPRMIAFVRKYPSTIPNKIPGQLDAAGLLVRQNGKPVSTKYPSNGETPWGPALTIR